MAAILVALVALLPVALAGALMPLSRRRRVSLEALADPLEDERLGLLRALRELEADRSSGALSDEDYAALKAETEGRAVAVLKEIASRGTRGPDVGDGWHDLRQARTPGSGGSPRRWATAFLVSASTVAVVVLLLAGVAVRPRAPGESITGDVGAGASAEQVDPLAFFEERVRQHPEDVAARLDLAHRYLDVGRVGDSAEQYGEALRLNPENAEARAHLGLLLFLAGRPEDGLAQVERALAVDRAYPEALYIKGLILLRGLGQERKAASAFETYLRAAPFGAGREQARRLLGAIEEG